MDEILASKGNGLLVGSIAEAAADREVVITMLPDGKAVRAAVTGQGGLAVAMAEGAVLADMTCDSDGRVDRFETCRP